MLALATAGPAAASNGLLLLPKAPDIRKIRIEGNEQVEKKKLTRLLTLRTADLLHPFRSPHFYRGQVQQDAQTLENYYRSLGFIRATVRWDTLSAGREVDLVFHVEEGTPVRVAATELRGTGDRNTARLREGLLLKPGKPYTPNNLEADRQRIDQYLADRGYPFSAIQPYVEISGDSAVVIHRVDPGPATRIGNVDLAGGEGLNPRGLRRELTIHPGDDYSRREVERSRQRLYDTGYFKDVQVDYPPEGIDTLASTVGVRFGLNQRKQHWFGTGVGYTSDALLRLTGEWGTRSFLGTGRRARLAVRTARDFLGKDKEFFNERENYAALTLTEPWLFGTRLRGQVGAYYHFDNLKNELVQQEIVGLGAQVSYELKERRNSVALIYDTRRIFNTIESDSVQDAVCAEDPILCQDRYSNRSITARLTLDERDDFLNPTRGHRHELLVQNAGGLFGGDVNFLKALDNSSYLWPRWGGGVVALRARAGIVDPAKDTIDGVIVENVASVPFEERFFVGGATSVRGYQENTLNGLRDGRDPTGGGILEVVLNLEYRFTVRGPIGGVLFLDAGNVWRDPRSLQWKDLVPTFDRDKTEPGNVRYSVGGGLRFNSPVGPIRLEAAYRLSPAHDERPSDLHLAVGQTF